MATRRRASRPLFNSSLGLLGAFLLFCALFSGVQATASSDDVEVICHPGQTPECYPKIFQPTKDFQTVREDQDIPPGLHVRLNIQTGAKEAKLYDPTEEDPAMAGLPVDRSVVVVDPEPAAEAEAKLPSGAPAYEPVGAVKAPAAESKVFYDGLATLKKGMPKRTLFSVGKVGETKFEEALIALEEFAHDIYYGLKLAEDEDVIKALLCMMSTDDVLRPENGMTVVNRAQKSGTFWPLPYRIIPRLLSRSKLFGSQ